ncbi:MAG TPA: hypothetical protein VK464_28905 [Symbiobacteriaceae bacterium]|nr:hypothetical protein [Symbiobacteriaceae bacterium]
MEQTRPSGARLAWRKLRQRFRALWRWVIVRSVRGWFGGRGARPEVGAELGEVKQFPPSRWS